MPVGLELHTGIRIACRHAAEEITKTVEIEVEASACAEFKKLHIWPEPGSNRHDAGPKRTRPRNFIGLRRAIKPGQKPIVPFGKHAGNVAREVTTACVIQGG